MKQRAKQLWKLCVQIDVVIVLQLKLYEVEKRLLFYVHEWIKAELEKQNDINSSA